MFRLFIYGALAVNAGLGGLIQFVHVVTDEGSDIYFVFFFLCSNLLLLYWYLYIFGNWYVSKPDPWNFKF